MVDRCSSEHGPSTATIFCCEYNFYLKLYKANTGKPWTQAEGIDDKEDSNNLKYEVNYYFGIKTAIEGEFKTKEV